MFLRNQISLHVPSRSFSRFEFVSKHDTILNESRPRHWGISILLLLVSLETRCPSTYCHPYMHDKSDHSLLDTSRYLSSEKLLRCQLPTVHSGQTHISCKNRMVTYTQRRVCIIEFTTFWLITQLALLSISH